MNQDNNFNQNNFNFQGNNGMSNNQSLNNQSFNQNVNVNQQPTPSFQQPIIQQPISQPTNTFESGSTNNQSVNSKPPKKINLGLIIGIVVAVAVVGVGIVFGSKLLSNGGSNNDLNNGSSNNQNISSESIAQIEIDPLFVIALTNSGKLYAVGYNSYYWGNTNEINLKETTLLAEDVKYYTNNGRFYISNDNDLYISGVNFAQGGMYKQYIKFASNILKVSGSDLGFVALSTDGKIYAYGDKTFNGFGQKYSELTLIDGISDVKDINVNLSITYYLTNNNELYAKYTGSNGSFEKVLDNVENCNLNSITTKDGKIYGLTLDTSTNKVVANLVEGANGVINSSDQQFFTKDNVLLDKSGYNYETYRYFYPKDVKTMYFVNSFDETYKYIIKFAYLSNDNKLKLHYVEFEKGKDYTTNADEKVETLDFNTKNLAKILEFSSNSISKAFLDK